MLRSRSFMRFTMRVGLPHLGQSVLLLVSMTFLRSAVLAIFAMFQSPKIISGLRQRYLGANATVDGPLGGILQEISAHLAADSVYVRRAKVVVSLRTSTLFLLRASLPLLTRV